MVEEGKLSTAAPGEKWQLNKQHASVADTEVGKFKKIEYLFEWLKKESFQLLRPRKNDN